MIIDCIADLHGHYPTLEGGDLLIVAGDLTARDTFDQHCYFKKWLYEQPYRKKVVIAGNHDNHFIAIPSNDLVFSSYNIETKEQKSYASYLCDSGTEFEGLKIWGTPWTKTFEGMNPLCKDFTCDTEEELAVKFSLIPDDIDILVSHGPSYSMKDGRNSKQRLGSSALLQKHLKTPLFHSLKLHVFGHIHEGYGIYDIRKFQTKLGDKPACVYVNASHVNENYEPVNKPIRVIL